MARRAGGSWVSGVGALVDGVVLRAMQLHAERNLPPELTGAVDDRRAELHERRAHPIGLVGTGGDDHVDPGHLQRRDRRAAGRARDDHGQRDLGRRAHEGGDRGQVGGWGGDDAGGVDPPRGASGRARLAEVPSPARADADLRVVRALFTVMEEWKHRAGGPPRGRPTRRPGGEQTASPA